MGTVSDGPLTGVRVVELAGIGPGPFAAMMLGDMGAEVIRVDRPARNDTDEHDIVLRNRRTIAVDLKSDAGRQVVLDLLATADVLIEGFRPGVTERLGLGPDACHQINPRLVYARMTGWGQDGPLAQSAGHDITYTAITGTLWGSRRRGGRPVLPMNLLGDLGGGATYLAFGIACAILHARSTGEGQVVDANVVDGTASLANFVLGLRARNMWNDEPGTNAIDTGAPYYDTYACADGKEIAVGALEPQFYAELVRLSGAGGSVPGPELRADPTTWGEAKLAWASLFATRTRDEWAEMLEGTDACVTPVLSWTEAPGHPHLVARSTFLEYDGVVQAAPAPRFSRTPGRIRSGPARAGRDTDDILHELGRDKEQIAALRADGLVS